MSTTQVNLLQAYRCLCQYVSKARAKSDGSPDAIHSLRIWTALAQHKREELVQRGISEAAIAQVEREVMQNGR